MSLLLLLSLFLSIYLLHDLSYILFSHSLCSVYIAPNLLPLNIFLCYPLALILCCMPVFMPSPIALMNLRSSVSSKKSPNVYKSCPKIILLVKLNILTSLQKLPMNVGDLGK